MARQRRDFLRHIVNRVLAESTLSRQLVEEIRQQIGRAEDRYRFHSFGGDVRRLADYLESSEFDQLILAARSDKTGNGVAVLEAILEEAIREYGDIPEVRRAAEKRLKELREGDMRASKLDYFLQEARRLEKLGASIAFDEGKRVVKIVVPGVLEARVSEDDGELRLVYRVEGSVEASSVVEVYEALRRLVEAVRSTAKK